AMMCYMCILLLMLVAVVTVMHATDAASNGIQNTPHRLAKHHRTDTDSKEVSRKSRLPTFCHCKGKTKIVCLCRAKTKNDQIPLADILKHMNKNYTATLRFDNFKFETLINGTFNGFVKLSSLDLSNCSIKNIEVDAFKSISLYNPHTFKLKIQINPIQHIEPGTFAAINSWKQLSLNHNRNLGAKGIQTVINDLRNKTVHSLEIKSCGIFLDELTNSFFEPLRYSDVGRLNIEGNAIGIVKSDAFEPLKESLTDLTLWNFMYVEKETFQIFRELRLLNIGGFIPSRSLYDLNIHLQNITALKSLTINMRGVDVISMHISDLPNLHDLHLTSGGVEFQVHRYQLIALLDNVKTLKQLDLSGNLLFKYTDDQLCQLFENRSNFIFLSLHSNYLSHLPQCMFKGMYELDTLLLNKNRLTYIQKDLFKDLHVLNKLDLSRNALTFIHSSNLEIMSHLRLRGLSIYGNKFECNCQLKGLRNWLAEKMMKRTKKFIVENCSMPSYKDIEYVHNFTMTWLECNTIPFMIGTTVSGGLIIFLIVVTLLLLRYFWKDIEYRRMIFLARNHERDGNKDGPLIENDAFVSYHSEKQLWVDRDLCQELENGEDIKFRLMFDDRIMPGGSLFTSLGQAIHTSRKIIFVVSRGWVKDAMNQFEVDMALVKLLDDYRDMIIVLLMEHIPKHEMPDKVKMIIKHNNCLRWSNKEKKQAKFWRDLKLELGKHHFQPPDENNVEI
ncbi:unnamed protein product, partial [Owenia fusiformis]